MRHHGAESAALRHRWNRFFRTPATNPVPVRSNVSIHDQGKLTLLTWTVPGEASGGDESEGAWGSPGGSASPAAGSSGHRAARTSAAINVGGAAAASSPGVSGGSSLRADPPDSEEPAAEEARGGGDDGDAHILRQLFEGTAVMGALDHSKIEASRPGPCRHRGKALHMVFLRNLFCASRSPTGNPRHCTSGYRRRLLVGDASGAA